MSLMLLAPGAREPLAASPGVARTGEAISSDAEAAFIAQSWDRAAAAYGEIARREPKNGRAWYRIGVSLHHLNRDDEAVPAMTRAVENGFVGQSVLYNLAVAHAHRKDTEKTLEYLRKAVAIGFDQPQQLEQDEDLALIREDARFRAIVANASKNGRPMIGEPAWSPDGRWIVYSSDENGKPTIFIIGADGRGKRAVGGGFDYAGMASWSPDGSRIVFSAGADFATKGGTRDVYVMERDGSHPARMALGPGSSHYARFSPDGRRIVFNSDRDGHREIYVANSDGSSATRLTHTDAHSDYPSWSPDGRQIVFESQRDGSWETFRMGSDGSRQTRLTTVGMDTSAPRLSPDGRTIAFHSTRNGSFDVYVMSFDGTGPIRLTDRPGFDGVPDWSPDGRRIVFVSNRSGRREIYTMAADGRGVACVTCDSRH